MGARIENLAHLPRASQVLFCIVSIATGASIAIEAKANTPVGIVLGIIAGAVGTVVSSCMIIMPQCSRKVAKALPGLVELVLACMLSLFFLAVAASVAAYGTCSAASGQAIVSKPSTASGAAGSSPGQTDGVSVAGISLSGPFVKVPPATHAQDMTTAENDKAFATVMSTVGRRHALAFSSGSSGSLGGSSRRKLASQSARLLCASYDATVTLGFLNFLMYAGSAALAGLDMRAGKGLLVCKKRLAAKLQHGDSSVSSSTSGSRSLRDNDMMGDSDADVTIIIPALRELPVAAAN